MCMTLINVHTCKHMNVTSTQQLSWFSDGTDRLICRRVSFRSSSIMSLPGSDNSGDHSVLKHDTS
jgi:hypothetical protein